MRRHLFRSVPNDAIKLRELLERFGLLERFTPYVSGGRGAVRGEEAREWLKELYSKDPGRVSSFQNLCRAGEL